MQIATLKYQIATYSGHVDVRCNENDDNDTLEAKAIARLRREFGELPFGCQSFQVVQRINL